MRFFIVTLLLISGGPSANAADWSSLARTSKMRTVVVRLDDGRKITGKIIETGSEGLRFAPEKSLAAVSAADVTRGTRRGRAWS
jgi:hypothetical protein